jgi:hypothetical protein
MILKFLKYFGKKPRIWMILIWILVLSACNLGFDAKEQFRLLNSKDTGIDFNNALEESHIMNIITYPDFYSGGGVSIGDIDNDGLPDLFFTGNQVPPKLYKNLGDLKFKDITDISNLDKMPKGWYTGTSMVDLNADGWMDIYVCRSGMAAPEDRANLLYINNRDGTFHEAAAEYGLDNKGFGVNAYFFDYDRDGDIDVYVANQTSARLNSEDAARLRNVSDPYSGDKLYENAGDTFKDVTEQCGLYSSQVGFTHGIAVGDINNDGLEDIYVSNDFFEYDYLYINDGDKTFTEKTKEATKHISHFSMGNDMADYNNDGLLDIVVLDMVAEDNRRLYMNTGGNDQQRFDRTVQHGLHYQYMFNVLHLNNGNETFSEIGMLAGISRTDWSWAPLLADFDNDGFKDLYVTNGIRKDIRNIDWSYSYRNLTQFSNFTDFEASQWDFLLNSLPSEPVTNYMFRNNGDLTFNKVMNEWGMDQKSYSNGVACGDLDLDGDLDLVVNNVDAEAFVYENRATGSNYLQIKLSGDDRNTMALGTKVRIYHGNKYQYQQHYLARGYRSSMEPIMHFGLGNDTVIHKIEIIWPDGRETELSGVESNQVLSLNASNPVKKGSTLWKKPNYIFKDVTEDYNLSIRHRENEKIDFRTNPILPHDITALGPKLAVGDVNGDGLDDFYLAGSYRFTGQLYTQTLEGSFIIVQPDLFNGDKNYEDAGATFFDIEGDGDLDLYLVSGSDENKLEGFSLIDRIYINDGKGYFEQDNSLIPELESSGSVAKAADFDSDGDLDLFLGGRMIPGNYPESPDSYLLLNKSGHLVDETSLLAPELKALGMVTDAAWSDYDMDGDPDLIIVGEWMPVTIFRNDGGTLKKITNSGNGLEFSSGWWWRIEAMDFDHDGDPDYVLGNIGHNYKFKPSEKEPLEIYINDFNDNGKRDLVIGYHQAGKIFPAVDRNRTLLLNRYLKNKIPSNDLYALLELEDIYGSEKIQSATNLKVYTHSSGILENKGNGNFEFRAFDQLAQISVTNSIVVEDFNRDGFKDLVLAGNFHLIEAETIRMDAGVGTYMLNDKKGNFESIPYHKSGLYLDGDVRDLKILKTAGDPVFICAKNNDYVQLIKYAEKPKIAF